MFDLGLWLLMLVLGLRGLGVLYVRCYLVSCEVSTGGRMTCNSLQKSMAFTPLAPSAGPTGGDGVAFPAGTTIFYV
jgi:hypothetical protein